MMMPHILSGYGDKIWVLDIISDLAPAEDAAGDP